ncbi:dephospho-CoA kinase [Peptacetobacter sp.]|uniref:dephospho-CoA kinase n=1 Tax=Peptacetobacter sp. TaxID=2991975 RepID=UPI00261A93C3|nr:dephospho-CoA kinase [Peptacetobacter sp.]
MSQIKEIIAPPKAGRLDSFLSENTGISRSKIKKYIQDGAIIINKNICLDAAKKLNEGDNIQIEISPQETTISPIENTLKIYYQDEYLAVIEKPANLTVHPCPSCTETTLVHHVLFHFPSLQKMEGERPGIVHRLDKDTSGLMIIALTEETRLILTEMFAQKKIHKKYLALVHGICPNGKSQLSIGRHPVSKTKMAIVPENKGGKEAFSEWTRLYPTENFSINPKENQEENFSLLEVCIHTGRTHQIRVHLSHAGYPLLGDELYAPEKVANLANRQMLHAYKLEFPHPITGKKLFFTSTPPKDFWDCLQKQLEKKQKAIPIIITGSSGTGKSACLECAKRKNFPTFSADKCIDTLYQVNNDAWYLLKNQYGTRFVPNNKKPVNKQAIAEAMKNPLMKQELENLLHPLVLSYMLNFFQENKTAPLAIAEIPLWFEIKPQIKDFKPVTITISADYKTRIARLQKRGWSDETIQFMENIQLPQEEKIRLAHYHIENTESFLELETQFNNICQQLLEKNSSLVTAVLKQIQEKITSSISENT